MTQPIDQARLKAAAEHLEWVLRQYPESEDVQGMLHGLQPLIDDAKAGRVLKPMEKVPFAYNVADGVYVPYKNPSVGEAYARFANELEGGLTEEGTELRARIEAMREAALRRGGG